MSQFLPLVRTKSVKTTLKTAWQKICEKRKTENGKRKTENGKLRTESGELRTESAPHKATNGSAPIKGGTPAPSNPPETLRLDKGRSSEN